MCFYSFLVKQCSSYLSAFRKCFNRMIIRTVFFCSYIFECCGRRFPINGQKKSKPAEANWFITIQSNTSRIVCIVIISVLTCVFFIIIIYQIIKVVRWCISRYAWQKSTFSISTSFVNLNLV